MLFPEPTTRSEKLPKDFIETVLSNLKIRPEQLSYIELGAVDSTNYLQHVSITATPGGWAFYKELKESYGITQTE